MQTAWIDEVFASVQGEGTWVGQRHIFVRFIGCDLCCGYCDSPDAVRTADRDVRPCRAQESPESFDREEVPNPVAAGRLSRLCRRLVVPGRGRPVVSLTGGEPLLQAAFLQEWLPDVRSTFRIYLETNGTRADSMADLNALVDIVSMDVKLPSATGQPPCWDEHRRFLTAVSVPQLFVKAVVTSTTSAEDVLAAAHLLESRDRSIPFVLQPASGRSAPDPRRLVELQLKSSMVLDDVRVIPQVHRMLGLP